MIASLLRRLAAQQSAHRALNDEAYLSVRRDVLLQGIELEGVRGLEIGPLAAPLVRRDESTVLYVDHCSTDELKKKYEGEVPATLIEDVDVVWEPGGATLEETLKGMPISYVVASHVVEHVPDLIDWLRQIERALSDGGALLLAVPDKRFTFDCGRQLSSLGEMLEAHRLRRLRPSDKQLFDNFTMARRADRVERWRYPNRDVRTIPYLHERGAVWELLERSSKGEYIDCHCWIFSPRSFLELLLGIVKAEMVNYRVEFFQNTLTNQHEFIVGLRKSASRTASIESLKRSIRTSAGESIDVGLDEGN